MIRLRKLVQAIAAASALTTGMAHALGLGDIHLRSALNQPLDAEIELVEVNGLEPTEVISKLASPEAFSKAGVDRQYFLTGIKFTPVIKPNGKSYIRVTSDRPVKEPYLSFLVEVMWPNGRVLREYTVLLDPPLYSAQTTTAAAPYTQKAPVRTQTTKPDNTTPGRAQRLPAPPPVERSTAAPLSGEYRTTRNDTLWEIAASARPNSSVSVQQTMLAIQDMNPDAFLDGNINRLKSGQVLRLPNLEKIKERSKSQATDEVSQQYSAWREARNLPARQLDGTPRDTVGSTPKQSSGDRLELASGQTSKGSDKGRGIDEQLSVTKEALDATTRENEELQSKVSDLQSQLDKLNALVELKNKELAKLQSDLALPPAANSGSTGSTPNTTGTNQAPESTPGTTGTNQTPESTPGTTGTNQTPESTPGTTATSQTPESTPGTTATNQAPENTPGATGTNQTPESTPGTTGTNQTPNSTPGTNQTQNANPGTTDSSLISGNQPPAGTEVKVTPEPSKEAPQEPPPEPDMLDQILSEPVWLGAIAGSLLLALVVVVMLSRRKAAKQEELEESTPIEPNLGPEDASPTNAPELPSQATVEKKDVLSEADIYIAYGRFNQAAELLQGAIYDEPQRTDLRIKLMEVYAEIGDREGFSRQENELSEIGGADAQVEQLKSRYPGTASLATVSANASDEFDSFSLDDLSPEQPAKPARAENDFGLSLDDIELDVSKPAPQVQPQEDFAALSQVDEPELITDFDLDIDTPVAAEPSKLDELKFDLDLGDVAQPEKPASEETDFLLDWDQPETAAPQVAAPQSTQQPDLSLDLVDPAPVVNENFAAQLAEVSEELDRLAKEPEIPPVTQSAPVVVEDDEFDFLAGADETSTKLDLARAYIDMGDSEGARDILDEVLGEGSEQQKQEAREMLARIA